MTCIKMVGNILKLLIFVVISDCTFDSQNILFQISSGDNVCNNIKLFKDFKFSDIPEFGSMCNIPVPNQSQVEILLENNVIPILCMGVYEVSLKLCSEGITDVSYFKELFPPSPKQFLDIFNVLKESENYSALNTFCSKTARKQFDSEHDISYNSTKFWWDVLKSKFNNNDSCISMCRTNEYNQVHPLCSYIVWSNDMVHNHQKSLSYVNPNYLGVPVGRLVDKTMLEANILKQLEGSQELPNTPVSENDKSLTSQQKLIPDSTVSNILKPTLQESFRPQPIKNVKETDHDQKTTVVLENKAKEIPTSEIETNIDLGKIKKGKEDKSKSEKPIEYKSVKNTSSVIHDNNIIPVPTATINSKNKESYLSKTFDNKQDDNNKLPGKEINLNSVAESGPKYSITHATNKDTTKPNQIVEDANNDLNEEINLDNIPADPPVGNDPETQQQFEQLDEDDEPTIGENPENIVSKTKGGKFLKGDTAKDHGKPDDVYSEGDRTILIEDPFIEVEDTHFFSYFLFMAGLTIVAYLAFHNKNKLLALAVEGRRSRNLRRRPNSCNYSKLDCSLEEAMVSNTTASVTHVLY